MHHPSSRRRYDDYRQSVRAAREGADGDEAVASAQDRGTDVPRSPIGLPKSHIPRSPARSFLDLFAAFWRMLRGQRHLVAFALATLTVATLLRLVPPAATKLVVDYVLIDNPLPDHLARRFALPTDRLELLFVLAAGVAAVALLATAIHLWGRWQATKAVNRVQVAMRRRVFEHAVRLPLGRIQDLKSGGTASILREDAGGVGELIFSMIYNPWQALVQLTGSLIVLAWVDWRLMLGGLALLPAVYFTHRTWISRIRPLYRDMRRQRQEIDAHSTEVFGGIRVVRTFGRERSEAGRFVRNNDLLLRQSLFVWWWARIIDVIWDVLIPLATAALLLYGGYRVLSGALTPGDLMMFVVYLTMLLSPIATLASSATTFQNNLAGFDRVLDLLEEPREAHAEGSRRRLTPAVAGGSLAFRGVSFRYPGTETLVLRDIDLHVEPGETIALVGRSGAGKTTLCNLVARFYDPTAGSIELGGVDLREIELGDYRRLLGIVEQDVFLFDGTIAENIGYGVRKANVSDIEAAARAANAHEFIARLPDGFETLIGERGVRLSGGQRQRLAIARAILADPRILILDEATSNLDTQSERLIQQSLHALLEGRTSFIIAHRLSTVMHADRIIVLEAGRIAEVGSHSELVAQNGIYSRMVATQFDLEGLLT